MKKEIKKHKDEDLEKIPLLVIYKQGGKIIADQPEEVINRFEFYGFLYLYTNRYGELLGREILTGWEEDGP